MSFAPFSWWPLAILSIMVLFGLWLNRPPRAFAYGFAFGLGQFGVGVSWMYVSIHQYGGMPPLIAGFCILVLILILSLFPAFAGSAQNFFSHKRNAVRLVFIMPVAWLGFEWLRGWIFTGLPWLTAGYAMLDTPLSGLAPLSGVYGVSLALLCTAGALLGVFLNSSMRNLVLTSFVLAVWVTAWQVDKVQWSQPVGEPVSVAIVQNNVPLMQKWDAQRSQQIVNHYLDASKQNLDVDLVVWPEAAVPQYLDQLSREFWDEIKNHPADFVFGLLHRDEHQGTERYFNSMVAVSDQITIYHKQHLVPFGEYFPLQWLLQPLIDMLSIPMSDFSAWPEKQPPLYAAGIRMAASICYEDAFPGVWRHQVEKSGVLINISEDMWFGDSLAPHQRLQMARFRAKETERPMIRSSNNGLSSLIDWNSEILEIAPQFEVAVAKGSVQPRTGLTPYVRHGDLPALSAALLLLLLGLLFGRARVR